MANGLDDDLDGEDAGETMGAIELLEADHDEVKELFEQYEALLEDEAPVGDREELAQQICTMLTVHAAIEEEILYPAAREVIESQRLVEEALVEHNAARQLVTEIEQMSASDAQFDAKVCVLGEYVRHHIEEEEHELLPQLADAGLDLDELGEQLAERKQELMAELGADETT